MKKLTPNSLRLPALAGVALGLLAGNVQAATSYYFDVNGATAGYGVTAGGTYSWDGNNWATTSGGGAATGAWGSGGFARFYGAASYTVTVNASEVMAGMYQNGGSANTLTISDAGSGTGALSITSTGGTAIPGVTGGNVQGFLCTGNIIINCPIIGAGGIEQQNSGSISLFATNSYAGGTWVTGGQGIFYNNNYAFGKGVIYVPSSGGWFENDTGTALTITNRFVFPNGGVNYNFVSGHAVGGQPGTTWSGPVSLPASGAILLNISSDALTVVAFSNVISGSASLNISDNGTCILAGTNTYTGTTGVGAYTAGTTPTVEIAGALAGDLIIINGAKLVTLDHAATLKSTAKVSLSSSLATGAINLNYNGSMTILGLYIDGFLQQVGTWGAPGSGAANQSAFFTGPGILNVAAAPTIIAEPQSVSAYQGFQNPSHPVQFTVTVTGDQSTMNYQWKRNNGNLTDDGVTVSGSQSATLTLSPPYTAGTYTCAINNVAGSTNTLPATLTLIATNDYVNAVLQDAPLGYWRLDETNGTTAYDWIGYHHAGYVNANIGQPGFSVVTNSDLAMSVPKNTAQRGFAGYTNAAPDFSFTGTPYTLEAWAYSTNFSGNQRIISTAANAGGGYALSFAGANTLMFTINFVADWGVTVPNFTPGQWYHCVVTFDGNNYTLYLNGQPVGTKSSTGFIANPSVGLLCFGNDDPTFPVSEQVKGGIDEVALYNNVLSPDRVLAHYVARYSDAPLSVSAPTVTPGTNYVSLSATLSESASGASLTYQWYHGSGTGSPVGTSSTSSTLTLGPLQLSDAGSYHCVVTDAGSHTADTTMCLLCVSNIPTSAAQINLTNGLVLHLPFDTDYKDISGRNNNGTAVGATSFATGAAIGNGALHYSTTSGTETNYVTLGVPADLQFGSNTDFTVSYWVRGAANAGLPFICDSTNGLAGIIAQTGGFYFGPDSAGDGGFAVGVGSTTHGMSTSGSGTINDGNWHHLLHVINRAGYVTTFMDGAQVDSHVVSFVTDSIDTGLPVNIGQDGTALLAPAAASGDIDDVAIWNRQLTQFEVSGVWLAGATNHVSMAPLVVSAPPLTATTISSISATALSYTGGSGTHFVLQGTTNLVAPAWTRLLTNSATPGSFTLPVSGSSSMFYRVSSEN